MLVAKCQRCNNIYDMNMKHRKEGNKTRVFTICNECGMEKTSHFEVGGKIEPFDNKEG